MVYGLAPYSDALSSAGIVVFQLAPFYPALEFYIDLLM